MKSQRLTTRKSSTEQDGMGKTGTIGRKSKHGDGSEEDGTSEISYTVYNDDGTKSRRRGKKKKKRHNKELSNLLGDLENKTKLTFARMCQTEDMDPLQF